MFVKNILDQGWTTNKQNMKILVPKSMWRYYELTDFEVYVSSWHVSENYESLKL